jgi:dephospho-CoA kinase
MVSSEEGNANTVSVEKETVKLGITGGIGSGKTSVCKVFRVFGIPTFSADPSAREIMDNDERIKKRINSITGKDLYADGHLDRTGLAALIFNDNALLAKVNELVHPAVFETFRKWAILQDAPYVIMEAAILFESGANMLVDKVATVVAPIGQRIQRVIHRNNLSREQVMQRIRNQMDDDQRIKLSDYVINNSDTDLIIPAVLNVHEDILNFIRQKK